MVEIIEKLEDIKKMGEYYIQEKDKQLKIECKVQSIRIYDITARMIYLKEVKDRDSIQTFKEISKKVNNCKELIEHIAFKSNFNFREMNKNEIFNPFFKELEGELQIKSKTGRFTKTQVEKILKHKDTKVIREQKCTDDYAYDAKVNFEKGTVVDKLSMLEEVYRSFNSACEFENGEFSIFTVGNSTITKIINKNIKLVNEKAQEKPLKTRNRTRTRGQER